MGNETFIDEVFDSACREGWLRQFSPELGGRLDVLVARDRPSDDEPWLPVLENRARRAAWESYLNVAKRLGLFDGENGRELLGRFRSLHAASFRSALSECLVAWFLSYEARLNVRSRASGQNRSVIDLAIILSNGSVNVEVKAPLIEHPVGDVFWRNDEPVFRKALSKSARQFAAGEVNILCLVPTAWYSSYYDPSQVIHALYGRSAIRFPVVDPSKGVLGEPGPVFVPSGSLLRFDRKIQDYQRTRISAVLIIEERIHREEIPNYVAHNALLLHNPHAKRPLDTSIFRGIPQFAPRNGEMVWIDDCRPQDLTR